MSNPAPSEPCGKRLLCRYAFSVLVFTVATGLFIGIFVLSGTMAHGSRLFYSLFGVWGGVILVNGLQAVCQSRV